jgi:hypothetical protein
LLAANVTGGPEVEALMRGDQTNALLLAMVLPEERRSPGWRPAHIVQTIPYALKVLGGSAMMNGIRMASVPGSRVIFDVESAARYGRQGPVEIGVDDDGILRSAWVSSPLDVVASVYRSQGSRRDDQIVHAEHLASILSKDGSIWEVIPEDPGGRGVGGDPMTDAQLKAADGRAVNLQMVQLDAGLARSIGTGGVVVSHAISKGTIVSAITSKDAFAGKGSHDLVLCCPFNLGTPFREAMSGRDAQHFDTVGWGRVWLSDSSGQPVVLARRCA